MRQQGQKDVPIHDEKLQQGLLAAVLTTWARTLTIPLRIGCGKHFVGIHMITGPIWIFLYAGFIKTPELLGLIPVLWISGFLNLVTHAAFCAAANDKRLLPRRTVVDEGVFVLRQK